MFCYFCAIFIAGAILFIVLKRDKVSMNSDMDSLRAGGRGTSGDYNIDGTLYIDYKCS